MGAAIAHRGPDSEGTFVHNGRPSVGLLNRRLAIIDISGGDQPITVEDGAFTIVYNGELYNTAELRHELELGGQRFHTRCDTEVIVRGYAVWGTSVLDHLDGMWAFAIWDARRHSLFLSRDRLGIKPLVYAHVHGSTVFGSEIKALVASGLVQPRLEPTALPHYLSAFAVPEPLTMLAGVRRLPAGHALLLDSDGPHEWEYWDCASEEEQDRGAAAYRTEIAELLEDSVQRTLVSDVPVGVLLSGGVDSRLLATYAARHSDRLQTFTLGFDDPRYDERPSARVVASKLGTEHHDDVMDIEAGAAALPKLIERYDEPGQSLIQTSFISGFARQHVTVGLSGLGGDELFSAYPTHVAVNLLARFDALTGPLRPLATAALARTPSQRLRRLAELSAMDPDRRVTDQLFHQTSSSLRSDLLSDEIASELDLAAPVTYLADWLARSRSRDPLNRVLYLYIKTYLPNELLRATDAMSMLHSFELRVPFLCHRLVERAMEIPAQHKMRLTKGKLLLREIAQQALPLATADAKQGFSPPLSGWLQGTLGAQVAELLAPDVVRRRGLFDPAVVAQTVRRARAGEDRIVPAAMMLYCFESWAQSWLDCRQADAAVRPAVPVDITTDEPATGAPELSVVIVSWNTQALTRCALQSLRDHLAVVRHEVIVIDNNSSDDSADMVAREFPEVKLIRNGENVGFGRANNQGMHIARGEWLLLLNSDAQLIDDSVAREFRKVRADRQIGAAHCRLLSPDGSLQHTVYRFPSLKLTALDNLGLHKLLPWVRGADLLGGYWAQDEDRDVDWVAAAFMLVRREVFEETGGFDESIFMYGEDLDWCWRIHDRAWRIRYLANATVLHHDHASSDILWGQQRIDECLQRAHELVARRKGRLYAVTMLAMTILGAALRLGYYRGRAGVPLPGRQRYRAMLPYLSQVLRSLRGIAARPTTGAK
jgi:asparagine synthase (glutamine-hydrolysing)